MTSSISQHLTKTCPTGSIVMLRLLRTDHELALDRENEPQEDAMEEATVSSALGPLPSSDGVRKLDLVLPEVEDKQQTPRLGLRFTTSIFSASEVASTAAAT